MRRLVSIPLVLLLAAGIHLDWHFARPHHYRLSLAWEHHWLFGAVLFAAAGCCVALRWPAERWRAGALNVALALVGAQVIEPVLFETLLYDHRLGYDVEPARWAAFAECVGAGIPAFLLVLALARRRPAEPAAASA